MKENGCAFDGIDGKWVEWQFRPKSQTKQQQQQYQQHPIDK